MFFPNKLDLIITFGEAANDQVSVALSPLPVTRCPLPVALLQNL